MFFNKGKIYSSTDQWLYQRLRRINPSINPHYSFNATVNWLRALTILCQDLNTPNLLTYYKDIRPRKNASETIETRTFEFCLMAYQNLCVLNSYLELESLNVILRSAIVNWYYGIYFCAKSMIVALDGSVQHEHSSTANSWDRQIVQNKYIPFPFHYRLSSLIEHEYTSKINEFRDDNMFSLPQEPINYDDCIGAHLSYLKGTADYFKNREEQKLLSSKEFKRNGFVNFRKEEARNKRDQMLKNKSICFLHQAYRFRGKAHYRDALYLGYGKKDDTVLKHFLVDLKYVLFCFSKAAFIFCSKRIGAYTWNEFVSDIKKNSMLPILSELF